MRFAMSCALAILADDVSLGIEIFKVIDSIGDAQAIDRLASTDEPDIDGLRHGQAGRIPIGRECISRHGDAGAAHAHRAGTHDDKFRRERVLAQCQDTSVTAAREIEFIDMIGALRTNALLSLLDDPAPVKDLRTVGFLSGDCPLHVRKRDGHRASRSRPRVDDLTVLHVHDTVSL